MANKMIIDASHPEETRVVVLKGNRVDEFDFESASKRPLRGNIYLAKVTRVEPSLQAAFVDYGGNRHGFLAFSEIHPDYYQIPVADRQALLEEEAASHRDDDDYESGGERRSRRHRRQRQPEAEARVVEADRVSEPAVSDDEDIGGEASVETIDLAHPAMEAENEAASGMTGEPQAAEPLPPVEAPHEAPESTGETSPANHVEPEPAAIEAERAAHEPEVAASRMRQSRMRRRPTSITTTMTITITT